ncbi:MAG: deacetylase, partial [Clostridia bacterium]|nr:deacetylase [Clostridia bacterium]
MKLWIITKKQLMLGIVTVLALSVITVGAFGSMAEKNKKLPVYCVETEKKQIAISFDAAWGNEDTEQLIEIL